mmetsp:Transcript_10910/g.21790  ORF Transcript_10910/g.21790 Transcript_10910/m.21790 type:complete len:430 (+) Transcript_10910:1757-3046(+)
MEHCDTAADVSDDASFVPRLPLIIETNFDTTPVDHHPRCAQGVDAAQPAGMAEPKSWTRSARARSHRIVEDSRSQVSYARRSPRARSLGGAEGTPIRVMVAVVFVIALVVLCVDPSRPPKARLAPLRFAHSGASVGGDDELNRSLHAILSSSNNVSLASTIILVAGTFSYRFMILNFLCGLRLLAIEEVLVLAMDKDLFLFLQRLDVPVFLHNDFAAKNSVDREVQFGSTEFVNISKAKTALVVKALQAGVDVLFSDADIFWFRDPRLYLAAHLNRSQYDIAIQSDAKGREPPNINVCSGFYLVRSRESSIWAFKAIVNFEMTNSMSEQKSFNFVFCGGFKNRKGGPGMRIGARRCQYRKHNSTLLTLDRDLFPNGSGDDHQKKSRQFLFHANYIGNLSSKIALMTEHDTWSLRKFKKPVGQFGCHRPA